MQNHKHAFRFTIRGMKTGGTQADIDETAVFLVAFGLESVTRCSVQGQVDDKCRRFLLFGLRQKRNALALNFFLRPAKYLGEITAKGKTALQFAFFSILSSASRISANK